MNESLQQIEAFTTPGSLLRSAREAQGMTEREAADRLNLMPQYVGLIERDDYQALRSPSFARGYVRSYGRLLGLDERELMPLFDEFMPEGGVGAPRRIETRPLQLQSTGRGVVIGVAILAVLMVLMWWWRGSAPSERVSAPQIDAPVALPPVSGVGS